MFSQCTTELGGELDDRVANLVQCLREALKKLALCVTKIEAEARRKLGLGRRSCQQFCETVQLGQYWVPSRSRDLDEGVVIAIGKVPYENGLDVFERFLVQEDGRVRPALVLVRTGWELEVRRAFESGGRCVQQRRRGSRSV
jgi:hypothetical protein